ncbi:hypothetical protein P7K49_024956 [Saguinus oedipus]|uniref:E3 ubiquitin-protein ligase HECW1/2 N-terminal domain-containing protein n=1 Tax=Saguinus oedipus TaxID=9490 RepID=A0ABQ9UFR0_SAGOE|nr:hypothetical protein P7K49_024956 [Saguinus oedipus]
MIRDEVLSENFLDYKNRGVNGSHRGQIIWKIDASSYFVEREYFDHSYALADMDEAEFNRFIICSAALPPLGSGPSKTEVQI